MFIKRLFPLLLVLVLLAPSALAVSRSEIIDSFFESLYEFGPSWSETYEGHYVARSGSKTYEFTVSDNGRFVTEVSLHVPYSEMGMRDDATFPPALICYNSVIYAIQEYVPDGDSLYNYFSAYDIKPILEDGRMYVDSSNPWKLQEVGYHVMEAVHPSGAYALVTVTDDVLHFYCNDR